jgi:hypothetical protein
VRDPGWVARIKDHRGKRLLIEIARIHRVEGIYWRIPRAQG